MSTTNPGESSGGRREKSKFSYTCSLLSQYIKEKGTLRGLAIDLMGPRPPVNDPKGKSEASPSVVGLLQPAEESARKAVVLPDLNAATGDAKAPQMTIFYSGKVMVFDNIRAEKAREIVAMATTEATGGGVPTTPAPAAAPTFGSLPPAPSEKPKAEQQRTQHVPVSSDLPIARRVSLNRFLEKRKDRISSKAPYQVQGEPHAVSPSSSHPQEEKPQPPDQEDARSWLGLAPSAASSSSEQQKKE